MAASSAWESPFRSVTRRDVAELAGTSPATVSYVVNHGPKYVSPETRDRVLAAIRELGYRPDPVARSFRSSDTQAIGMLVPNFIGPFFADLVAEVERQATERDKVVMFASTGFDPTVERRMLQNFADRRVGAVLVIGPTAQLEAANIEHGALNVFRPGGAGVCIPVGVRQRAATRAGVEHLIEHGRSRLAAIFGPSAHTVFQVRYRGWRDATGYSREQNRTLVRRTEYSFRGGYEAARDLFSQPDPPDGLFVSNDTQAIGALHALYSMGLQVPRDVAVVSIDGTELGPYLIPALTSVNQPTDLIASAALDLVDANPDEVPTSVRVPFELKIGQSCGCKPVVN